MVQKRERPRGKPSAEEMEAFVEQGRQGAAPSVSANRSKAAPLPAWRRRAATAKDTEGQPFRHNVEQARLLEHAHQVTGKPKSVILRELVWPALEEQYGADVPFED